MSLYVDASALLKRYVEEEQSRECVRLLQSDTSWISARHCWVEVRRALARLLDRGDLTKMDAAFRRDWRRMHVVEIDQVTCELAAELAVAHGVRTLDALHLAAAQRVGGLGLPFLTYDLRQAQAARSLGMTVLGA